MNLEERYEGLEETKRPLLLIDSGLGGLNVLKKLKEKYPVENFVYICDNEFLPLGNKNVTIINRRVNKIIKKIKEINPKGILFACNTLDSISGGTIDSSFPSIDVFHIVKPTMEEAIKATKNKNIAILGTKNTIESQAYMNYALLKKGLNIYGVECVELANAIEHNKDVDKVLNDELSVLDGIDFDTLILGCTHYSIIKSKIAKKFKGVNIIDSSDCIIKNYEETHNTMLENKASKQSIDIFITKEDDLIKENISKVLKENYEINLLETKEKYEKNN